MGILGACASTPNLPRRCRVGGCRSGGGSWVRARLRLLRRTPGHRARPRSAMTRPCSTGRAGGPSSGPSRAGGPAPASPPWFRLRCRPGVWAGPSPTAWRTSLGRRAYEQGVREIREQIAVGVDLPGQPLPGAHRPGPGPRRAGRAGRPAGRRAPRPLRRCGGPARRRRAGRRRPLPSSSWPATVICSPPGPSRAPGAPRPICCPRTRPRT